MDIGSFVKAQIALLELEKAAETEASVTATQGVSLSELQKKGGAYARLRVVDMTTGLAGRQLVSFAPIGDDGTPLPASKISIGDIIGVRLLSSSTSSTDELLTGVVYRLISTSITVVFDDNDSSDDDAMTLLTIAAHSYDCSNAVAIVRLANEITYLRYRSTLDSLSDGKWMTQSCSRLVNVSFGSTEPATAAFEGNLDSDIRNCCPNLNPPQHAAIAHALCAADISLIHGPPGTGKTTTVVELIRLAALRGMKILACGASNVSVDNIAERLVASNSNSISSGGRRLNIVRVGHPARLLPSVLECSLDYLVSVSDDKSLANDVRRELDAVLKKAGGCCRREDRRQLRAEARLLRKELRHREDQAVKSILLNADVVLSTCVGASDYRNRGVLNGWDRGDHRPQFDIVIIDEAAQALEVACWGPLLRGRKAVLAGDHCQLPPTVQSSEAEKGGLGTTLFDRLVVMYGDKVCRMLTVQYRMNSNIMNWSSRAFYNDKLTAGESVAQHLLFGLSGVMETRETISAISMIDTAGCGLEESCDNEGDSKYNDGEATIVQKHVLALVKAGVSPKLIGVITPYNAQVERLRSLLRGDSEMNARNLLDVEIGSVDGFQGREKEAIIISMVRSNSNGNVGFLAEHRRMNVAVTRARRHVCIIGDSETVGSESFLLSLITYCNEHGDVRSAAEDEYGITPTGGSKGPPMHNKSQKKKQPRPMSSKKLLSDQNVDNRVTDKNFGPNKHSTSSDLEDPQRIARREELVKLVINFVAQCQLGGNKTLSLPSTLSSLDRLMIHEAAGAVPGLSHVSSGVGPMRCLVLKMENNSTAVNEVKTIDLRKEFDEDESEGSIKESNGSSPSITETEESDDDGDDDVVDRQDLEQVDDDGDSSSGAVIASSTPLPMPMDSSISSNISNSLTNNQKKNASKSANEEEDFDSIIEKFRSDSCQYNMSKNKVGDGHTCRAVNVKYLGATCALCKLRYCLSHMQPEVHGCGDEAKKLAREQFMKDAKKRECGGLGNFKKQLNDSQRAHVAKKLEKKIASAASSRTSSNKAKTKDSQGGGSESSSRGGRGGKTVLFGGKGHKLG